MNKTSSFFFCLFATVTFNGHHPLLNHWPSTAQYTLLLTHQAISRYTIRQLNYQFIHKKKNQNPIHRTLRNTNTLNNGTNWNVLYFFLNDAAEILWPNGCPDISELSLNIQREHQELKQADINHQPNVITRPDPVGCAVSPICTFFRPGRSHILDQGLIFHNLKTVNSEGQTGPHVGCVSVKWF